MDECPECDQPIHPKKDRCRCGWVRPKVKTYRQPAHQRAHDVIHPMHVENLRRLGLARCEGESAAMYARRCQEYLTDQGYFHHPYFAEIENSIGPTNDEENLP